MFTGIVQAVGTVEARRRTPSGVSFTVKGIGSAAGVGAGDSIAVNGVCQTVERCASDAVVFTSVAETLRRTTMGFLRVGDRVNLETAVRAEDTLGGHMVQGHVDGVGVVRSFVRAGTEWVLRIRVPRDVEDLVVPKGAITIDGVSLTVMERRQGGLVAVAIVPYTREKTIVSGYRPGTKVNVEADVLARYVRGLAGSSRPRRAR